MTILERIEAFMPWHWLRRAFLQCLAGGLAVLVCALMRAALNVPLLPFMFFLPGTMASAFLFGRVAGISSTVIATLTAIYFFLEPFDSFMLHDQAQGWSVILFIIVNLMISEMSSKVRSMMLHQAFDNRTLEQRVAREVEEKAQVNEALRQSQKMEAIGQLTGGISHDFNNILMGVSGSLELLRLNVERQRYDKLPRYIETAETATKRASDLTHRLLAFSRKQTLEPKRLCANTLIEGMLDLLPRTLGPSVVVKTMLSRPGLWHVRVDPTQLESAVLNLCLNSRDAMPRGGTITISVENSHYDAVRAQERDLVPGDYVSISVTDTGSGIAPEMISRVFEPFFTTKAKGDGTGLGLAMVHGFARQSGGQVRCHSQVGLGTTMRIILPRDITEDIQPEARAIETPPGSAGELILVVDDEAPIREILSEALSEAGYRVLLASGGNEAIECLRAHRDIDLVLTDVGMPISGRVVADKARELLPAVPVLFVTGFAAQGLLPPDYLDDRRGVVTKPFAINSLLSRIADMIGGNHSK